MELFESNDFMHNNHVFSNFLTEFSPNTNPNANWSDPRVFKFLPRSVDGKHLMRFQSVIAYGAKLLNADWLRQRAFFSLSRGDFWQSRGYDYLMLIG